MRKILLTLVFLAGCNASDTRVATQCEPFAGLTGTPGTVQDKALLKRASADFCAVLAGKTPPHARLDPGGGPSDGGTLLYHGDGYTLTALRSLSSFGSVRGVIEGPVLTFTEPFAPGHTREITQTRFVAVPAQ